jgi:membrane-associated phospholipid phosphatase
MNLRGVIRWWPPIGLLAMALLGVVVGKGLTAIDEWFTRTGRDNPFLGRLLFFTDPRVLAVLLLGALLVAMYRRRWRVAAVVAVTPVVAVGAARLLKRVFARESDGVLAYPSGHTALAVAVLGMAVLGMAVLAAGAAVWAIAIAVAWSVLAALGQAFTYHYFTDTVGAVLLTTALLCIAAWAAQLDGCQPRCDRGHSGG